MHNANVSQDNLECFLIANKIAEPFLFKQFFPNYTQLKKQKKHFIVGHLLNGIHNRQYQKKKKCLIAPVFVCAWRDWPR